jgi:hypothetical protein
LARTGSDAWSAAASFIVASSPGSQYSDRFGFSPLLGTKEAQVKSGWKKSEAARKSAAQPMGPSCAWFPESNEARQIHEPGADN